MPNHNKSTKTNITGKVEGLKLYGLDTFRKNLERDFYAVADISSKPDKDGFTTNLVIDLKCNFSLTQCLFHLNTGNWGGFLTESQEVPKFEKSIQELIDKNKNPLDIIELSINLRDTSLIISKIYPNSIQDYLGAILPAISANFIHFTKGLTEMPFEIFFPVFLDQTPLGSVNAASGKNLKSLTKGYFNYWGLYFESNAEKDAVIYDVKNKTITKGDFSLKG